MLKRLYLLVIKSYIGPLILTFFISEFVLMMHFVWLYIEDLVGKGLEWTIIAELLLYASAGLVPMALPLAILLASIMTFGNMGEHYELTAMKSAGISLQKIMTPLIILSVVISIGIFFFSNIVLPYTNLKAGSLLYDVSHHRPELNIKPGIFNTDIAGYRIKIKEKKPNSPIMYDFMIYDHTEKRGNTKVTLADSGKMEITDDQKFMIVTLYNGNSYEEMKEKRGRNKKYPSHHDEFEKQTIIFELESSDLERTDEALFKHNYQMKNLKQLSYWEDSLQQQLDDKKLSFIKGMNRSKYFRYTRKISNYSDTAQLIRDSILRKIQPKQLKVIYNLDSLYNSFDARTKHKVLEVAVGYAENSKKQIIANQKDFYSKRKNIQKHRAAWHEKLTLSFACLIFFFIGAPLGAIIRKGGFGLPFLVSIVFFLSYYVVTIMGKKFAVEGNWMAWQGMWLSSAFTLPMGVFLTYKATTDSVIFNFDTYIDLIVRPFKVYDIKYKNPDAVFKKDVTELNEGRQLNELDVIISISEQIQNKLAKQTSNLKHLYLRMFNQNQTSLLDLAERYNATFNNLAYTHRNNKFMLANLKKMPEIEYPKYEMSKKKIIANYYLLSVFLFPVGILVLIRSYLKLQVLNKKLEQINYRLLIVKHEIEHKGQINKLQGLETVEDSNKSKYPVPDTKEKVLEFVERLNNDATESHTFLNKQNSSFYTFLKHLLTVSPDSFNDFIHHYHEFTTSIIPQFNENPKIKKLTDELPSLKTKRKTKFSALINYLILSIIPLAVVVFYISYLKTKKLSEKINRINTSLKSISTELQKDTVIELKIKPKPYSSIISEKNINDINMQDIHNAFIYIKDETIISHEYLKQQTSSFYSFLKLLLSKDINELEPFFNFIHRIVYIIKKQFKNETVNSDDLKTYRKLDFDEYKMTEPKIFANYLLLSFILIPVGLVVYYISYKKIKKLIWKIESTKKTTDKILLEHFQ